MKVIKINNLKELNINKISIIESPDGDVSIYMTGKNEKGGIITCSTNFSLGNKMVLLSNGEPNILSYLLPIEKENLPIEIKAGYTKTFKEACEV